MPVDARVSAATELEARRSPATRPLRWGIIGPGGMGAWHVRAILGRPELRLVAAADISPAALEGLPPEVARFGDWRKLLDHAEIDGASAILPHHLYPEVVIPLLERGVHVVKEKPFARNLADAAAMARAAAETGKVLLVAGQHKLEPSIDVIRSHLPDLGGIFLTRAANSFRSSAAFADGPRSWRGSRELSGGLAILNIGWHIVELVLRLRGQPTRVTATTGTMAVTAGGLDIDEHGALILDFADGGIAIVVAGMIVTPTEFRVTLHGARATLDWNITDKRLMLTRGSDSIEIAVEQPDGQLEPFLFDRMYAAAIAAIDGEPQALGSWRDAIETQRVIEAAYLSIDRGNVPVGLDDVPSPI